MNLKKPAKGVADLNILKDIRGLLSTPPQEKTGDSKEQASEATEAQAELTKLRAQLKALEEQAKAQKAELAKLKAENSELAAKLKTLIEAKPVPLPAAKEPVNTVNSREIEQLEARIEELGESLVKMDELLRMKAQELLNRIARVFNEAGQSDVSIEFRKGARDLELAENMAHFLRVLLD